MTARGVALAHGELFRFNERISLPPLTPQRMPLSTRW